MKGYYKNWYQHYLEVEQEKEKEMQRGYYSNLIEKEDMASKREKVTHVTHGKENHAEIKAIPVSTGRSKKNKFNAISLLLPVVTILGFIFLWYQLDIGPVRKLTDDVLVFTRIKGEGDDVVGYHMSLLDQHTEFAEKVEAYITSEDEVDFELLKNIYDDIHAQHREVANVSGDEYEQATSLWPFMLKSTSEMMTELASSDDVDVAHKQFVADQEEIGAMIRSSIGLGTEFQ